MRPIELEAWTRRVIEQTLAGATQEDSRVELKAEWPEPKKCGRQIAGHCNASRGLEVLWIIGVDEKAPSVVGIAATDMATWWPQVMSEFDGAAPSLQELSMEVDGKNVVAILFETERAPFVVKNAAHGQKDGGPVAREVPWREGTSVRSATRVDLLSLLIPLQELPSLEVIEAEALLFDEGDGSVRWVVTLTMYATLRMHDSVVFPDHLAEAYLRGTSAEASGELDIALLSRKQSAAAYSMFLKGPPDDTRLHTVHRGDNQLILDGPGFLELFGDRTFELDAAQVQGLSGAVDIAGTLRPVGSDLAAPFKVGLKQVPVSGGGRKNDVLGRWATA